MPIDNDGTFETEDDTANAFLKLWDAEEPSEEEDKEGETESRKAEDTEDETTANETKVNLRTLKSHPKTLTKAKAKPTRPKRRSTLTMREHTSRSR
jgi:hypothetical protein